MSNRPDVHTFATDAMRRVAVLAAFVAMLMLAACGDASPPEEPPAQPGKVVAPKVRQFREAVVGSVAFLSPELASQTRRFYRALDSGERSQAVREAGGLKFVQAELRAAELFHFAHALDGCIDEMFSLKTDQGKLKLLQRLAAGKQGAELIAAAKRYDPDGYAFDLYEFGEHPSQLQRIAAAYETLSVHSRTISKQQGSDQSVKVYAEMVLHTAAVSNGRCVPDPKLLSLLDSMP